MRVPENKADPSSAFAHETFGHKNLSTLSETTLFGVALG